MKKINFSIQVTLLFLLVSCGGGDENSNAGPPVITTSGISNAAVDGDPIDIRFNITIDGGYESSNNFNTSYPKCGSRRGSHNHYF